MCYRGPSGWCVNWNHDHPRGEPAPLPYETREPETRDDPDFALAEYESARYAR